MSWLTPRRRRGIELLDDPAVDPRVMQRSMRDVELANSLFGGRRAAVHAAVPALAMLRGSAILLDVGSGRGDIPASVKAVAGKSGLSVRTIGLDLAAPMAEPGSRNELTLRGDAMRLPFRDRSVDLVMASQLLHHFEEPQAIQLVAELNRVAREGVVISDLRRSFFAAAGLWLASFPLRFHPVSRHDGVVSVMRGFVSSELADIVEKATGLRPLVRYRPGFRITATWRPA